MAFMDEDGDGRPATRGDMRRVHARLDDLTTMLHTSFVTVSDLELLRNEVHELKGWQTWGIRVVLAAVILALLALVFSGKVPQK